MSIIPLSRIIFNSNASCEGLASTNVAKIRERCYTSFPMLFFLFTVLMLGAGGYSYLLHEGLQDPHPLIAPYLTPQFGPYELMLALVSLYMLVLLVYLVKRILYRYVDLAPRPVISLRFQHKDSEVYHGGENRFHQVLFFHDANQHSFNFEQVVFDVIHEYAHVVSQSAPSTKKPVFGINRRAAYHYLDMLGDLPHLPYDDFLSWYEKPRKRLEEAIARLRLNAIVQERATDIEKLDYFCLVSAVTLILQMWSEYFAAHYERMKIFEHPARRHFGRILQTTLDNVRRSKKLQAAIKEKLGLSYNPELYNFIINENVCASLDATDDNRILENLDRPNPYLLNRRMHKFISGLLEEHIKKTKRVRMKGGDIAQALNYPPNVEQIVQHPKSREELLKLLKKKVVELNGLRLPFEAAKVRKGIMQELIKGKFPSRELLTLICYPRRLLDVLGDRKVLKRFSKESNLEEWALNMLESAYKKLRKKLRVRELLPLLEEMLQGYNRFKESLYCFRRLRSTYGLDPNKAGELRNIKLWRMGKLSTMAGEDKDRHKIRYTSYDDNTMQFILNAYEEGKVIRFVPEGSIYVGLATARRDRFFLFADLRGSTETSMRLTRDTASFLSPYLTTIDDASRKHDGGRIYFAGDGYAAHYPSAKGALAAAYEIQARFARLRSEASEEIKKRTRHLFAEARGAGIDPRKRKSMEDFLKKEGKGISDQLRGVLVELNQIPEDKLTERMVEQKLIMTVSQECMPQIEIGIGLTAGELLYAVLDDEDKTRVVITPQLNTAARLSGSDDAIERHIVESMPNFDFRAMLMEGKLFNRGIVFTSDVYSALRQEVRLSSFSGNEAVDSYYDGEIKNTFGLRPLPGEVNLKGLAKGLALYELLSPDCSLLAEIEKKSRA